MLIKRQCQAYNDLLHIIVQLIVAVLIQVDLHQPRHLPHEGAVDKLSAPNGSDPTTDHCSESLPPISSFSCGGVGIPHRQGINLSIPELGYCYENHCNIQISKHRTKNVVKITT